MKNKKITYLLHSIVVVPLLLGIIGYLEIYPKEYLNALYFGLRLYGFNYDINEVSFILEIARWLAPLVLVSTIALTIKSFAKNIHSFIQTSFFDPIAVYGSNQLSEMLCEDIEQQKPKLKLLKSDKVLDTNVHIIMFENDQENLRFFAKNTDKIKGNNKEDVRVYIQLEDFNDQMFNHEGIDVYPFSVSYTVAQLYWRSQCEKLCAMCYENKAIHIAFIGEGIYAQKLVEEGLLFNIYSKHQEIIYHVYGNWDEFEATHLYWNHIMSATNEEMKDKIIFHKRPWYAFTKEFNNFDKVIICEDKLGDNLHIAHKIKTQIAEANDIDLLLFDHDMFSQTTSKMNHIQLFGDYRESCTYDIVVQEQLIKEAKHQHETYCANEKKKDSLYKAVDWYDLSNFIRNSNITSSNFNLHNLKYIKKYVKEEDEIAELEHIRWARYHYINNWQVGNRDNNARIHPDLISYAKLSQEDKDKDYNAKKLNKNI